MRKADSDRDRGEEKEPDRDGPIEKETVAAFVLCYYLCILHLSVLYNGNLDVVL